MAALESGHQSYILTTLLNGQKGHALGLSYRDTNCSSRLSALIIYLPPKGLTAPPPQTITLVIKTSIYSDNSTLPLPTCKIHKIHALLKYKIPQSNLIALLILCIKSKV